MFVCERCSVPVLCQSCETGTKFRQMGPDQYSGGVISYPSSALLGKGGRDFNPSPSLQEFRLSSALLPRSSSSPGGCKPPPQYQNVNPGRDNPSRSGSRTPPTPPARSPTKTRTERRAQPSVSPRPQTTTDMISTPTSPQCILRQQHMEQQLIDERLQQQQLQHLLQIQYKHLLEAQLLQTKQQLKDLEAHQLFPAAVAQPLLPSAAQQFLGSSSIVITASQNPMLPTPTFEVSSLGDVFSKSMSSPATDQVLLDTTWAELQESGWYHGDLSWQQSNDLLEGTGEGTFLLRASQSPGCLYTLSVNQGKIGPTSIRIYFSGGRFRLDADVLIRNRMNSFSSVGELVEFYLKENYAAHSVSSRLQAPISLVTPLYQTPPSLAHMSRIAINKSLRAGGRNVNQLELPKKMVEYLSAYKYTV